MFLDVFCSSSLVLVVFGCFVDLGLLVRVFLRRYGFCFIILMLSSLSRFLSYTALFLLVGCLVLLSVRGLCMVVVIFVVFVLVLSRLYMVLILFVLM